LYSAFLVNRNFWILLSCIWLCSADCVWCLLVHEDATVCFFHVFPTCQYCSAIPYFRLHNLCCCYHTVTCINKYPMTFFLFCDWWFEVVRNCSCYLRLPAHRTVKTKI
jgi:hypothetical protein